MNSSQLVQRSISNCYQCLVGWAVEHYGSMSHRVKDHNFRNQKFTNQSFSVFILWIIFISVVKVKYFRSISNLIILRQQSVKMFLCLHVCVRARACVCAIFSIWLHWVIITYNFIVDIFHLFFGFSSIQQWRWTLHFHLQTNRRNMLEYII